MNEVVTNSAVAHRAGSKRGMWIMGTVLLVLVLCCGYLFLQYRHAMGEQAQTDQQRIADITKRVQGTVVLPDEQPTIATVADTRKLSEPELAAQAQNGDELLVYAKARRVILYRPRLQKIVDMFRVQDGTAVENGSGTSTTH